LHAPGGHPLERCTDYAARPGIRSIGAAVAPLDQILLRLNGFRDVCAACGYREALDGEFLSYGPSGA
ncbi:MAG: hypothetical protein WCG34_11340, partial [Leptolinea sp.]